MLPLPHLSEPTEQSSLYEQDFWAWTQTQAELLKHRQWDDLDLPNLIEEIESLGRQQRQELRNRLSILIGHLLKWQFQPHKRTRSWISTIRIQRLDIDELLEDNSSLKPDLNAALRKGYLKGVELAVKETNLPHRTFPPDCPYSLLEVLDSDFYPGEPSHWAEEPNL